MFFFLKEYPSLLVPCHLLLFLPIRRLSSRTRSKPSLSQFYYLTKEGAVALLIDDFLCSKNRSVLGVTLFVIIFRFTLTNYKKYIRSWFSLHRVEIVFNNSVQATFNATGIYAPSSYSYHCHRVSSLQRYDALLLPSYTDDVSSLWEVTFVDFQVINLNRYSEHLYIWCQKTLSI